MSEHHIPADRFPAGHDTAYRTTAEETQVVDARAGLTPSQMVEQRLVRLLNTSPLMLSHVQRWAKPGPR